MSMKIQSWLLYMQALPRTAILGGTAKNSGNYALF